MTTSASALVRLVTTSAVSYFVPPLLVRGALSVLKTVFPSFQPTSQHARFIHHAIILLYVAYTIVSSYVDIPVNCYDLLGLTAPAVTANIDTWKETLLRPQWLALVRVYHPDKNGGSEHAQALFRILQRANEVLKHDVLRGAYERFGSSLVDGPVAERIITTRDALTLGCLSSVGWYAVSLLIFIIVPAMTSRPDKKIFWRLSSLLLLLANELALVSSAQRTYSIFGYLPVLTHELVTVLRHAWIGFNVILSHLPYLADEKAEPAALTTLAPIISNLIVRSDVSSLSLDNILRNEVRNSHDKEQAIDRIVETMVGISG